MSERQRIHGHDDEEEELPAPGSLKGTVPTAPDPDVSPAGTKEVQDPPGRDLTDDLTDDLPR